MGYHLPGEAFETSSVTSEILAMSGVEKEKPLTVSFVSHRSAQTHSGQVAGPRLPRWPFFSLSRGKSGTGDKDSNPVDRACPGPVLLEPEQNHHQGMGKALHHCLLWTPPRVTAPPGLGAPLGVTAPPGPGAPSGVRPLLHSLRSS